MRDFRSWARLHKNAAKRIINEAGLEGVELSDMDEATLEALIRTALEEVDRLPPELPRELVWKVAHLQHLESEHPGYIHRLEQRGDSERRLNDEDPNWLDQSPPIVTYHCGTCAISTSFGPKLGTVLRTKLGPVVVGAHTWDHLFEPDIFPDEPTAAILWCRTHGPAVLSRQEIRSRFYEATRPRRISIML